MTAKVLEFKPKLTTPTHSLYRVILEAFNQAHVLKVTAQALSARQSLDAVTCATVSADEQKQRAQQIATAKYEAQLVEQTARNVGETLTYRRSDFPSDVSFFLRQLHALDAEIKAIEAQQICAGLLADVAECEGHDRPVGECDFLKAKLSRKQAESLALQSKIVALCAATESGSGSASTAVAAALPTS
ncbi:hypothetical protein KBF38_15915 [bacterium]|nr:hypothetical protein [bacterium]